EALLAGANEVRWTEPYYFRSTGELGISAVVGWLTSDGHRQLFASDLRLIDFSRFTRSLVVGKSGFTAVLTPDGKVIGLPRNV
ncbi:hypothetical protein, partial [Campylobacter jejuni]|uniref:hypothetical protein n=1 Tax=Campylobacter jejuni TaxID=197 RepID=UPI001F09B4BB